MAYSNELLTIFYHGLRFLDDVHTRVWLSITDVVFYTLSSIAMRFQHLVKSTEFLNEKAALHRWLRDCKAFWFFRPPATTLARALFGLSIGFYILLPMLTIQTCPRRQRLEEKQVLQQTKYIQFVYFMDEVRKHGRITLSRCWVTWIRCIILECELKKVLGQGQRFVYMECPLKIKVFTNVSGNASLEKRYIHWLKALVVKYRRFRIQSPV